MVTETYNQALAIIDPQKAKGKPHLLWVNYAKFYEQHDDLPNARKIFEKAVKIRYENSLKFLIR
jgi:pre-mRNA-splicing factor SYF1